MSKIHAALVLCLGLAACGGGGGAGSAPIITSDNYLSVAQEALASTRYLITSGSFASPTGAAAPQLAAQRQGVWAALPQLASGWGTARRQLASSSQTQTVACPEGGSMTVSAVDANGNGVLDSGDSLGMLMAQCQSAGVSVTGALAVAINSLSGDISAGVYSMGASMTPTNLTTSSAASTTSGSGSIGIMLTARGLNDESLSLTVPNFVTTSIYANVTHSVTLSNLSLAQTVTPAGTGWSSAVSVNGSFSSSAFNNHSLTLNSVHPFVQSSAQSYPASGQLVVSDATQRKVRITALSATQVQIEVDASASGVYALSLTKLWSELL